MIDFDQVSVTYADAPLPALRGVDVTIEEGELCLVAGGTGSGKSTLLGTVNGRVPHSTGGTLHGRVRVAGRDTREHRPRDLADLVGVVGQDPLAGMVTDVVEDELAYGCEQLALPADVMRRRVEETLDLLGLVHLRDRPLLTLSGGERQRVAIGSVLTSHPRVLVLDEPTSALDPPAAEEVLAALHRLVHDLGLTVLVAEHRLERIVGFADRVLWVPDDATPPRIGTPSEIFAHAPLVPPVVALGRVAGWDPPPVTVRDARRRAGALRERLDAAVVPAPPARAHADGVVGSVQRLIVTHGPVVALGGVDLAVRAGEVVAVMGRNGAGKSTLLGALTGLVAPAGGSVDLAGDAPIDLPPAQLVRRVGYVPQQPADLFYAPTVAEEAAAADGDGDLPPGTCAALLARLLPDLPTDRHPRDLSEGQRLTLALAIVLASRPPLVLLDEPTRGLDPAAKARLVAILEELADDGHGIVLATHDVELAAEVATRTVVLADGEVVADGPTDEVVTASPAFAPQVTKVLGAGPWLTVGDVAAALEVSR